MECRRGLAMRILSVCTSVCHTRELWQNGRKTCPDLYTTSGRNGSTSDVFCKVTIVDVVETDCDQ